MGKPILGKRKPLWLLDERRGPVSHPIARKYLILLDFNNITYPDINFDSLERILTISLTQRLGFYCCD